MTNRQEIFDAISNHRDEMDKKWGADSLIVNGDLALPILMEEVGAVARALIEDDEIALMNELYDIAQIVVAWLEAMG